MDESVKDGFGMDREANILSPGLVEPEVGRLPPFVGTLRPYGFTAVSQPPIQDESSELTKTEETNFPSFEVAPYCPEDGFASPNLPCREEESIATESDVGDNLVGGQRAMTIRHGSESEMVNVEIGGSSSKALSAKQSSRPQTPTQLVVKTHRCQKCSITFATLERLNTHMISHTSENKAFKCPQGPIPNPKRGALRLHTCTHTGKGLHQCDVCGKSFTHAAALKIHKRAHTGERPYKCNLCEKSFKVSSNLRRHRRIHTGERPYPCVLCGKSFTQQKDLHSHKRTHTGERPRQCDLCDKCFANSSNLRRHRVTHTSERPYSCVLCGKSFKQNKDLQIHKRTHTGERPYQCDLCEKSFANSSSLRRHRRIHTGPRPHPCVLCGKSFTQKKGSANPQTNAYGRATLSM